MPGIHYCTAHGALYGYSTACTGLGAAAGENERGFSVCDMDNDIYQIFKASFPDLSSFNTSLLLACSLSKRTILTMSL